MLSLVREEGEGTNNFNTENNVMNGLRGIKIK